MSDNLWSFALNLYAKPGIETLCLEAQAQGADVCLLLCAAWLQQQQKPYNKQLHQALVHSAQHWQEHVIRPLRTLRIQWRTQAQQDPALSPLREQLKTLELAAEKALLNQLEAQCEQWLQPMTEGKGNWLERLYPDSILSADAQHQLRIALESLLLS